MQESGNAVPWRAVRSHVGLIHGRARRKGKQVGRECNLKCLVYLVKEVEFYPRGYGRIAKDESDIFEDVCVSVPKM